jgi:hypothetical protein
MEGTDAGIVLGEHKRGRCEHGAGAKSGSKAAERADAARPLCHSCPNA